MHNSLRYVNILTYLLNTEHISQCRWLTR